MNFKAYHKTLEDLHVGTLKPRAYFIPYDNLQDALSGDRNKSYYMTNLCGDWKFKYYSTVQDVTADFSYRFDFMVENAFRDSRGETAAHITKCLKLLCDAERRLHSQAVNERVLFEQTIAEMLR